MAPTTSSGPARWTGWSAIFSLHCDPRLAVGQVGLRVGAITSTSDRIEISLTGTGGHTARPHLTADLVYALGSADHRPAGA